MNLPTLKPDMLLMLIASSIIGMCVATVLLAVIVNFVMGRNAGTVKDRRSSFVATGSMIAFFILSWYVLKFRIGVYPIDNMAILIPLTIVGVILVIAGSIVNILGRFWLGRNWANQATVYEQQTLITSGVYSIVRHPLYSSLIWMFFGASLVFHNPLALCLNLLVFVPMMIYRAGLEEKLLVKEFPEYADYQQRVGMLFPFLGRKKTL